MRLSIIILGSGFDLNVPDSLLESALQEQDSHNCYTIAFHCTEQVLSLPHTMYLYWAIVQYRIRVWPQPFLLNMRAS